MVGRYKVISVLMAFAAVFLVIFGFDYMKIDLPNLGKQQGNLSFELDEDWDNDGLTNREESYWNTDPNNPDTDGDGYLDGEEAVSGHDPLIPAPDDFLPTDDNLTQKMSQLTVAGLYEGSLKPESPDYGDSLNNIALEMAENAANSFKIDLANINLGTASSDKNSQQGYIDELSKIYEKLFVVLVEQIAGLEENLIDIGLRGFADKDVVGRFNKSADEYKNIFSDLSEINIPKEWEPNHLSMLKLAGELSQASQIIASGKEDPIKATVALNKVIQLWKTLPDITEAYSRKIHNLGLSSEKTIFK